MLEYTQCYFCGQNNTEFVCLAKGFRNDPRIFNVVKCKNCSLVYINPRYSEKENYDLYKDFYYTSSAIDPSGKVRSFLTDKERKIKDHKIEINYIKKYKKKGKILDFGAATGFFLEALEGNWDKYAVDISEFAISNIKTPSVNKYLGTLLDAKYEDNFFDVIYIGHTLDRLINLRDNILETKRILKNDGIIFVTLPNIDSLCAKLFKENFRLLYSNHLIYFSPKTLNNFLNEAGLKIIEIKYPFNKTSFFSWRNLPIDIIKILLQIFSNILNVKTKMTSPPFWGNIMCVIVGNNNV